MSSLEALTEAGKLLAAEGWTQGASWRDKAEQRPLYGPPPRSGARYCMVGALDAVAHPDRASIYGAARLLARAVGLPSERDPVAVCASLADWNDAPTRTVNAVLAAYREAIRLGRAQGSRS